MRLLNTISMLVLGSALATGCQRGSHHHHGNGLGGGAAPTILAVSPSSGPTLGGTRITVTGTGFVPGTTVSVGGSAGLGMTYVSGSMVSCLTPPGPVGPTSVTVHNPNGQFSALLGAFTYVQAPNQAPTVYSTYAPSTHGETYVFGILTFTVTASDPDGDAITLTCVNPPPGAVIPSAIAQAGPVTTTVQWEIPNECAGLQHLVFRATDSATPPNTTLHTVSIEVIGAALPVGHVVADVTGDGRLDLIARATGADSASTTDAGAVYVWAGATTPSGKPTATLAMPAPQAGDQLGLAGVQAQGIQCADVTGDGVLDVIVAAARADVNGTTDAGTVFVWRGGSTMTGSPSPAATLRPPTSTTDDWFGALNGPFGGGGWGQAVRLRDLTGDGCADILVHCLFADISGTADTGALYLWVGGSGLTGTPSPTTTFAVPGAATGDRLGQDGVRIGDVTGDGLLDIVAGSSSTALGGVPYAGAVYVFAGASGYSQTTGPAAVCGVPNATAYDGLTGMFREGLQLIDLTGDGTLDILAGASHADVNGVTNAGAVYLFKGGTNLTGNVGPHATMTVSNPSTNDWIGRNSVGSRGMLCADVTGDGQPDVIVNAPEVDLFPYTDQGAVYVWQGGSGLSGSVQPLATLTVSGGRLLGHEMYAAASPLYPAQWAQGIRCADLSGDGVLDVVVSNSMERDPSANVSSAGAIYVWNGGSTLSGTPTPTASLRIANPTTYQLLGVSSVYFFDVTGDGITDLVTGTPLTDIGGTVDTGSIYVWAGGSSLTGAPSPTATLVVAGANANDCLGQVRGGKGILCRDVTGDGQPDIIGVAPQADVGGATDAGAIYVWIGGSGMSGTLTPAATLTVPGASAGDGLGEARAQSVRCGDVTGDGVLDIIAGAELADAAGVTDAGALYVWAGGSSLTGAVSPTAVLANSAAAKGDAMGAAGGRATECVDLDGDGVLDVLGAAPGADVAGTADTGALYFWRGGAGLTGRPKPTTTYTVPNAASGDRLGD